jgi:hypothetical protein
VASLLLEEVFLFRITKFIGFIRSTLLYIGASLINGILMMPLCVFYRCCFIVLIAVPSLSCASSDTTLKITPPSSDATALVPLSKNTADIRTIPMQNPKQAFEFAAKLQWNPHTKQWDKVLVLYNGHKRPSQQHPIWTYFSDMQIPTRQANKAGENLHYKAFHAYNYCTGTTALNQGKPLVINFDRNQLGVYQTEDLAKDWNCPTWKMGQSQISVVTGDKAYQRQGLQLRFPKGVSGCKTQCINWKPSLSGKFEQLYYSYWLKFPENFDFVLGGKLPGIGSEKPNTGGNKPNGHDGWSVRAMWNKQGQLGQYVYHMDQKRAFGEFMQWDMSPITKGKWHSIQTWVKLNTPQQKNGIIQTRVDGKVVLNKMDIRFRMKAGLEIERFLFSSFFGGQGATWAPKKDEFLYLDNVTISTQAQ